MHEKFNQILNKLKSDSAIQFSRMSLFDQFKSAVYVSNERARSVKLTECVLHLASLPWKVNS